MRRVLSSNQWSNFRSQHNSLAIASTVVGQAATRTSTGNQGTAFNTRPASLTAHESEVERISIIPMAR